MRALFALLLIVTLPAHATIYKVVHDDGRTEYVDHLPRGAKPSLIIPDNKPAPAQPGEKKRLRNAYRSASPTHFPKVDAQTQKQRDDLRQELLRQELGNEERELAASRAAFGASRPGSDQRVLAEAVKLHEKNIEMLNKELARNR